IIAIGIDYTMNFAYKARSVSTLIAITLTEITTVQSFGLLSLSQNHEIHSFGITLLRRILVDRQLTQIAIKTEDKTSSCL
ncbi:hypothetical protein NPM20_24900, partial [Vibrio parahaemolyticus]|uniref:hypothetical protein n=1 Tax=Vibrio parahaemolyticus TaxID=670 RepID=UPI0021128C9F